MDVVTEENFDETVLKSQIPVLCDFYAEWCMPCKLMAPILDKLAKEYAGRILIVKMDAENNATAANYGVNTVPTILMFSDGVVTKKITGVMAEKGMREILENALF